VTPRLASPTGSKAAGRNPDANEDSLGMRGPPPIRTPGLHRRRPPLAHTSEMTATTLNRYREAPCRGRGASPRRNLSPDLNATSTWGDGRKAYCSAREAAEGATAGA